VDGVAVGERRSQVETEACNFVFVDDETAASP
jgi:hypothetical protein